MKLIGIESAPLDKTKKVLAMIEKLIGVADDCGNGIEVFNEKGSKVEHCSYEQVTSWSDGWKEQTYFITMEHNGLYYNWICYIDKDDGYRSYAGLFQFKHKNIKLCHNLESFGLNCSYTENTQTEKEVKKPFQEKLVYRIHLKVKCKHKVIFNCYTDHSDSYYPIGIIEDHLTDLKLTYED